MKEKKQRNRVMLEEDEDYGQFCSLDDYDFENPIKIEGMIKNEYNDDEFNGKKFRDKYAYFEKTLYVLSVIAVIIVFVNYA